MARVSKADTAAHIGTRLQHGPFCGPPVPHRAADGMPDSVVVLGDGLKEFGLPWGAVIDDQAESVVRSLADGIDPGTGDRLVAKVLRTSPDAKLPATPLLEAIDREAADRGHGDGQALIAATGFDDAIEQYARLQRTLARSAKGHSLSYDRADLLAFATGISLESIYGPSVNAARRSRTWRVDVRARAYVLDVSEAKSHSILYAAADASTRAIMDQAHNLAINDVFAQVQPELSFVLAGHHGGGRRAVRTPSSGLLATCQHHRTTLPVGQQVPDPQLHAHIMILSLAHGIDGKWRSPASGGMEIYQNAVAINELISHQFRTRLKAHGARFAYAGSAWEHEGVDRDLILAFSKRANHLRDKLEARGLDPHTPTARQRRAVAEPSSPFPYWTAANVTASWHAQLRASGLEPDRLVADLMPGESRACSSVEPSFEQLRAAVLDRGRWKHATRFTRLEVLGRLASLLDGGQSLDHLAQLAEHLIAEHGEDPIQEPEMNAVETLAA